MNARILVLLWVMISIMVSCGDSKIEVQSTLLVVDTYPSNGAEIDADLNRILVFFSSPLDEGSISAESFRFEVVGSVDITSRGVPVDISVSGLSDDKSMVELSIKSTPLTAGAVYRLSIDSVKALNGARLAQRYFRFFVVKTK